MARPLRIDVEDGWYHITGRGIERREIFPGDRYGEHFLELLGEMSQRYAVGVHAYVLMGNHYHLLVQTPEANASEALQWLNVSYSVWFNRKQSRVGHVFQGRFKSVLVDNNGSWLIQASVYLHLNPVRVMGLGLGKSASHAEALGWVIPDKEEIKGRLDVLRKGPWNSYLAYAGYAVKPDWLQTSVLLGRAGGKERYRRYVESHVTRGLDPKEFETLHGRLVLGSKAFEEKARRLVGKITKEQPDRSFAARRVGFDQIVKCVEKVKGQKWDDFRDRYGDWGRNLVLYLARRRTGKTLREIAELAGGLEYKTVSKAIQYFESSLKKDRKLQSITRELRDELSNIET